VNGSPANASNRALATELKEVAMNTSSLTKIASAGALAAALSACAGLPAGYAQIDGHRYFRAPIDTYSVIIARIDDRDTTDSPVFVDPGARRVTVQGPPDGVSRIGQLRTIDLNVAPCTRYHLVAVKPNRLSSDFDVKVDYQEPIGGCLAPAVK
jgi:hypothetical protein